MKEALSDIAKEYCSVPVPSIEAHKASAFDFTALQISKYGQSQTHPSICYFENGWNGHKYWLATTPYPSSTEVFENPCIYYGDEDAEGNPPVVFTPINGTANGIYTVTNNPITKVSVNTAVNSDPALIAVGETLYMMSRDNTDNYATYMQKSLDGQSWTPRGASYLWRTYSENVAGLSNLLSPAFLTVGNEIYAYALSSSSGITMYNEEKNEGMCTGLWLLKGTTFEDGGDFSFYKKAYLHGKRAIQPWHMDMFRDESTGKFYMICCAKDSDDLVNFKLHLYLAESDDGLDFYMYSKPIISSFNNYRPTAFLRNSDREFVMYWSTTEVTVTDTSLLPNGASDLSTDGRYIGMSHINFDQLLMRLKSDKYTNY